MLDLLLVKYILDLNKDYPYSIKPYCDLCESTWGEFIVYEEKFPEMLSQIFPFNPSQTVQVFQQKNCIFDVVLILIFASSDKTSVHVNT